MEPADLLITQFRTYLKWNKCHLNVLTFLVFGLLEKQTVNFTSLATTFPGRSQTLSCYRRIQRFFLEVVFDESIMATLIASLFAPEGKWQLSMDRTNWIFGIFKINILFLAINYKGMSIPILWTLLPKKGSNPMVVICNAEPWRAISDYLQRWQIETMFQAMKGRGFNLEDTHLKDRDKISKLLCTLALAFCWAYKTGEWINETTPIKVKSHGRKAQSIFRESLIKIVVYSDINHQSNRTHE